MKRVTTIMIFITLLFSLFSCGNKNHLEGSSDYISSESGFVNSQTDDASHDSDGFSSYLLNNDDPRLKSLEELVQGNGFDKKDLLAEDKKCYLMLCDEFEDFFEMEKIADNLESGDVEKKKELNNTINTSIKRILEEIIVPYEKWYIKNNELSVDSNPKFHTPLRVFMYNYFLSNYAPENLERLWVKLQIPTTPADEFLSAYDTYYSELTMLYNTVPERRKLTKKCMDDMEKIKKAYDKHQITPEEAAKEVRRIWFEDYTNGANEIFSGTR